MKGFNEKLLNQGKTIGVALSGGEDSVCLLHLLNSIKDRLSINVVAINVEHGIRGESSARDTDFCVSLSQSLNILLKRYKVDAVSYSKENGLTLEEGARKLRYKCFYDAVKEGFCDQIAVAHHQKDNVETVLFNIFRGTTISGLKGMDSVSRDGVIIRPLLNVKKQDISQYVVENGLKFVNDETNNDTKYTRNFIRHDLLESINSKFNGAEDAITRLSAQARQDDEFLYAIAKQNLEFKGGIFYIPCNLDYPIFSRAVILAIKGLGVEKDFDNGHIGALFDLKDNISGKKVDLLCGLYGIKEHDKIAIKNGKIQDGLKSQFFAPFSENTFLDNSTQIKIERVNKSDYILNKDLQINKPIGEVTKYIDLDKIPSGAVIRKRMVGDKFTKFDGTTVSLKKYLTDKKIPKDKKDATYLICHDSTVLVIVGVEISSLVKIDSQTKNIAKISINTL